MVLAGLRYLAAADPTALAAQAQAECLQTLEQADAMTTAARARILAAFTAGQGYADDADYSPTSWLIHRTSVTKGAARGHLGWARRVIGAPAGGGGAGRGNRAVRVDGPHVCGWTDKLPADCREAADDILVAAARAGARQEDLAALAAEIYARSLPDGEDDPEPDFEDRQLRVETTFQGAGIISGDLTPGVRRGGDRGAGGAVGPGGGRGHPDPGAALPRCAAGRDAAPGRQRPAARAGRPAGQGVGARRRWPSCGPWTTGRCCRPSGSGRWPSGGPSTAPPPRRPAATAPPGWTARQPAPYRATPPSSRWSPAASTRPPWMT